MTTIFSDPKKISDELNSYFCNIAESILKDSDNTSVNNAPFEPYILKIPKPDSLFKFKRVTPNDIVYHVAKLKTSRSGQIPTRFLKDGVKCIAHVLSSLFNKSMESVVFPDNLKIAAICPSIKVKDQSLALTITGQFLSCLLLLDYLKKSFTINCVTTLRAGFTNISLAFVQSNQRKPPF